eukprot:CAMPEP_0198218422 /NCGR_PEP_ID=MMETSP1445-20131203/69129_1 /TAXON_ID=36898 /ORGANISM="Pyramimonas sp., Strain CCMP2087" /LENGTH=42 /DNA_ID= /DNA_START= /DNA_END= /DNA_ORIENTATION=
MIEDALTGARPQTPSAKMEASMSEAVAMSVAAKEVGGRQLEW